ncbi:MAG TPA: carboxypeptidase-like regulatory domain-containing protein, partial [Terriglobales bacterium]|nr:carboxypeptidase-like regulatory domain-containing protein [Terriglobales bacterium]
MPAIRLERTHHFVCTFSQLATQCAAGIILLFLSCAASAQTTGSIVGKVTDPSGAVVPGGIVKATNQATSFSREAITSVSGEYVISLLPVGRYTITAQKQGFEPYRFSDVVVNVNENIRVDVPLSLGKVAESVSVTVGVAEVETRSATLGKVIDETKIEDLPLNGRNFLNLAVLQPGVVPAMSLGSNNTPEFPGGEKSDFQVNGLRLQSNNFLLDGADNNEPFLGTAMATPSPDALEEFKILTNNYGAEFGGGGGSIVNIITKGGTNQFHGSLYEFFRNDVLDAENFFAIKKDKLRRNQFGGTFGGPVIRDRTFFFFNYEGFRLRQGQTQIATVPSDPQRAGNFGAAGTVTKIDPTAAALLPLVPRANVGTNEFVSSPAQVQNTDQVNARIDHKITDKNYLSVRYFLIDGTNDRNFTNTLFGVPINLPNFPLKDNYRIQNLAVTDTHFFTSTFSNELRFGFNRGRFDSAISTDVRDPASFGFNLPSTKAVHNMPLIALAGYTAFGTFNDSPSYRRENTYQIQDNVTWMHGRNSFRYGMQILKN